MAIYYNTQNLPQFKKAVITIGTFDGVHLGHHTILQEVVNHARETGGESVLLTFEPHPRKLLFPDQSLKLITPLEQKLQLLTEAGIQNIVVVPFTKEFSELSAQQYVEDFLVKNFNPACIVIGYDHHFGHDRTGDITLLKEYAPKHGYSVYEISAQLIEKAAVSSTRIRHTLLEGQVEEAAKMLGRNYNIIGQVHKGAQLGRTIGYPTANVAPNDADQLIPGNGVYAIEVNHGDKYYRGMLNIGVRPTVSNDLKLHIEAHLFDFDADIYDDTLELIFVARLRDEQKFPSLDALKEQLAKDKEAALQVLMA